MGKGALRRTHHRCRMGKGALRRAHHRCGLEAGLGAGSGPGLRAPACGPVFDPLMGTAQGAFAHPTEDWEPVFDPLMGTAQGAFAHPTEDSDPVCNEGFAESKDPSECSPVIVDQGSD